MKRFKADITLENSRMDVYVDIYRKKWLENNIILTQNSNNFFVEKHDINHNTVHGWTKCLSCGHEWSSYYKNDEPICPNCEKLIRKPTSQFQKNDLTLIKNHPLSQQIFSTGEDQIGDSILRNTNLNLTLKDNGNYNDCIVNHKLNFNDLSVDFYLPYYQIAIECQGKQHFFPTNMKEKKYITTDSLEKIFLQQIIRDMFKHDMLNGKICYLINETVSQYNFKDFLDNFLKNTQEILTKMDKETFKYCICDGKRRGYLKNNIQKKKQNEWIEYIISKLKNMYKKIYCYPNDLI